MVLFVTGMLVDLSVAFKQMTVSVVIMQLKVSTAHMQVTVSVANLWVTIFVELYRWELLFAVHYAHNCF